MSLVVERRGQGADFVLLHGWGMNTGVWEGLPPTLEGRGRQHRIALPGHGGSPLDLDRPVLAAWAEACLAMAPPRAIWVGWSLGGLLSLAAALRAPERLCGLILITTTPRFTRARDWPLAMPVGTLDQFQGHMVADPIGTLDRFLALQVRGSEAALATLRRLHAEVGRHPPADPRALAHGLQLLRESDLRAQLGGIRCPSLWLFGSRDNLVPAPLGERVAELLPSARIHTIAGAGHAPFVSHPEEFAVAMESFLTEVLL